MSTVRSETSRALALVLAVALGVSGCSPGSDPLAPVGPSPVPPAASSSGAGISAPAPPVAEVRVPRDLGRAFEKLLTARAQALMAGERAEFLNGLDQHAQGFVTAQNGYFDNLAQLPVQQLDYQLDRASLIRTGASYSVVVQVTFQLAGFDALPSITLHRFRFSPVTGGRYRISSVYDRDWETANDVQRQPWELTPIQVVRAPGVLGIVDAGTAGSADGLLRSVAEGIDDVAARVPYEWDRSVVFYTLSDSTFLDSLDHVPGENPDALDGLAFTVPAGPGDARVVATRVAFNPRVLERGNAVRDRLVRHELTHVAVAAHDDFAPTWLSEGIAEWVSVQAQAPQDRVVSDDALAAAEAGIDRMPDAATFNDTDADVHYAVAWWACEYLATTYGPTAPWVVLDAFSSPHLDEHETVEGLLSLSVDALARRSAKLMITTYDPSFLAAEEPPSAPAHGATPSG